MFPVPMLNMEAKYTGKGTLLTGDTERPERKGMLYLVASGAPAPEGIPELVSRCQAAGWHVLAFATPHGARFLDTAELQRLTGEPVRTDYRMPGEAKVLPAADAVLACPLTFNSVNKFAHGHADNFALGLLCELTGYGIPVVVVPHCKPQLAIHHAFPASIAALRAMGVSVLFNPDAPYERRLPSWQNVVAALPAPATAR
jgi:phosphopantothenoylcysteine synthetase/decarboxylase